MKKLLLLFSIAPLFLHADCSTDTQSVITALIPRSQERHHDQQLVGLCDSTYQLDAGPFYGAASLTGRYAKSFKTHHIAQAFFGSALFCADNHNPYLKIQGNSYGDDNRDSKALFADYFYLPHNYSATVSFDPSIKNYSADIDLYFGLNGIDDGLYLRIHSPLVHTEWNLRMNETIIVPGSIDHPDGYFTPSELPASTLLSRFSQYGCGKSPSNGTITQTIHGNAGITEQTVTMHGLAFAKLCCAEKKTGLADIRVELGKVLKETETYNFGVHLELLIPTGSKKKGLSLFEPMIGNGHHWELGGGVYAQYQCFTRSSGDAYATLYADCNVTHLFKTDQKRTFDLKNKPLSRYMLASYFTPAVQGLSTANGLVPSAQFASAYAPVANISTLDVSVACDIHIDASAMLHYHKKKWDFDCGYNLWYKSKEQITCHPKTTCCNETLPLCDPQSKNRWALKGDARMYGFLDNEIDWITIPLSATQNNATIYQGSNNVALDCSTNDNNNAIDNPVTTLPILRSCQSELSAAINTSIDPLFLNCSDLDIKKLSALSHTIFAQTAYTGTWRDYKPYVGLGGSAEFGMHNDENSLFALSQWTVWIKGGIAFD